MYNGTEPLIANGQQLPCSVRDFWQWSFPDLTDNTVRGSFAEFIVKTALDAGGYICNPQMRGWSSYDLDGPPIPSLHRPARIEVKCSSLLGVKHPDRALFSIAPAKALDPVKQDYVSTDPRQRNNDLYVFCLHRSRNIEDNILDMAWWDFYVLPTQFIEQHDQLYKQKTISLKTLSHLGEDVCRKLAFSDLCDTIVSICNTITSDKVHSFSTPPEKFRGLNQSRFSHAEWRLFLTKKDRLAWQSLSFICRTPRISEAFHV